MHLLKLTDVPVLGFICHDRHRKKNSGNGYGYGHGYGLEVPRSSQNF